MQLIKKWVYNFQYIQIVAFGILDVRFEATLTTKVLNPPHDGTVKVIAPPFAVDKSGAALHCNVAIDFIRLQFSLNDIFFNILISSVLLHSLLNFFMFC